jgi:Copper amine oxidase N-terminal domain/Cysteine-rich secretory protein family/Viral BACON domain
MKKVTTLFLITLLIISLFGFIPGIQSVIAQQQGKELFNKINDYRILMGLEKIEWHESGYVVAYNHSVNMHNLSQLTHNLYGKDPGNRLDDAGITHSCYVENVAFNQGQIDPIQVAFDQWKKSDRHNKNMLDDCAKKGAVAIVSSSSKGYYFTYLAFTTKDDDSSPPPDNSNQQSTTAELIKVKMEKGSQSPSYTMTWSNTGETIMTINWKVDYKNGADWILVSPTTTTLTPGQDGEFSFSFDISNLSNGTYKAELIFSHELGTHTIPIEMTVQAPGIKMVELWIGSDIMRVNGETIRLDAPPTIVSGRTVVPVRAISEAFGAKVSWDGNEKKVTITLGTSYIEMWVNSATAFADYQKVTIDPPPMIISGRTFVPFRFIGEALGATVSWDGDERKVTLMIE